MSSLFVDGLERHKPANPYNYTEEEQADKKLALKNMCDLYPDVSYYYAELIYDMCKNKSQEEINEIKKSIDTTPPKYDGKGGVSYDMEIVDENESLSNKNVDKQIELK